MILTYERRQKDYELDECYFEAPTEDELEMDVLDPGERAGSRALGKRLRRKQSGLD